MDQSGLEVATQNVLAEIVDIVSSASAVSGVALASRAARRRLAAADEKYLTFEVQVAVDDEAEAVETFESQLTEAFGDGSLESAFDANCARLGCSVVVASPLDVETDVVVHTNRGDSDFDALASAGIASAIAAVCVIFVAATAYYAASVRSKRARCNAACASADVVYAVDSKTPPRIQAPPSHESPQQLQRKASSHEARKSRPRIVEPVHVVDEAELEEALENNLEPLTPPRFAAPSAIRAALMPSEYDAAGDAPQTAPRDYAVPRESSYVAQSNYVAHQSKPLQAGAPHRADERLDGSFDPEDGFVDEFGFAPVAAVDVFSPSDSSFAKSENALAPSPFAAVPASDAFVANRISEDTAEAIWSDDTEEADEEKGDDADPDATSETAVDSAGADDALLRTWPAPPWPTLPTTPPTPQRTKRPPDDAGVSPLESPSVVEASPSMVESASILVQSASKASKEVWRSINPFGTTETANAPEPQVEPELARRALFVALTPEKRFSDGQTELDRIDFDGDAADFDDDAAEAAWAPVPLGNEVAAASHASQDVASAATDASSEGGFGGSDDGFEAFDDAAARRGLSASGADLGF